MSEYWVSRKKWTCKYCDVTINDDVPSRQQHENGLRHKGNVERSLRQAYKKSERDQREERDAKREMGKIERLAQESYAKDLAGASHDTGVAGTLSPSTEEPEKPEKRAGKASVAAWKPTNRLAAYGSALPFGVEGSTAEDEEQALKDWQERQEAKRREGTAGDWQTVAPSPSASSAAKPSAPPAALERDSAKAYTVREKRGQFGDDDDDGAGQVIKVKKRVKVQSEAEKIRQAEADKERLLPTWKPMRLDTGVGVKEEGVQAVPVQTVQDEEVSLVEETDTVGESPVPLAPPSSEDKSPTGSSSMFKKRKAGAGAGAKRVRAVI